MSQSLLVTREELAVLTNLSIRTLARLQDAGQIPEPIRINRRLLWPREQITAWVARGCKLEPVQTKVAS
jgi:predicted DNA-binding transcriptional regulator AlpA